MESEIKKRNVIIIACTIVGGVVVIAIILIILFVVYKNRTSDQFYPGGAIMFSQLGKKGNLGNQLFQIASTMGIAADNNLRVILPKEILNYPISELFDLARLNDVQFEDVAIHGKKSIPIPETDPNWTKFQLPQQNKLYDLDGYFQNPLYFTLIESKLYNAFTFKNNIRDLVFKAFPILKEPNTIGIHVRRGDYKTATNKLIYSECDINYFKNSLSIIKKKLQKNATPIIVCSDDITWCKENLQKLTDDSSSIVYSIYEKDPVSDFVLLTLCKHQIMSNSSFSWWAAWIKCNQQKDSIIVAPEPWYNPAGQMAFNNTSQIYYGGWIRLNLVSGNEKNDERMDYLSGIFDKNIEGRAELHKWVGEPYVVSLKTQSERWDYAKSILLNNGIKASRLFAFPKEQVNRKELEKMKIIAPNARLDTNGTIGCALSHCSLWSAMITYNIPKMMIFEDDITSYSVEEKFESEMKKIFSIIPDDWDLIFCGRCLDTCSTMQKIKDNVYRTFFPSCTHAYIISLNAAKLLLRIPIYTGIDSHMRDFILNGALKAYALHPSMFIQDVVRWNSNLRPFDNSITNMTDCELKRIQMLKLLKIEQNK